RGPLHRALSSRWTREAAAGERPLQARGDSLRLDPEQPRARRRGRSRRTAMSDPSISVVIPTLDEEDHVSAAVRSVRDRAEVLVVDGGSSDLTCERAAAAGARVFSSARGRGLQLDY